MTVTSDVQARMRRRRGRQVMAWLVGVIILPFIPILCLVWTKHASWAHAVEQGELFGLAIAVAGASFAIELILIPERFYVDVFRFGLLLLLAGDIMFFAGNAAVKHGKPATELDQDARLLSLGFFLASVVFGVIGLLHQLRSDTDQ